MKRKKIDKVEIDEVDKKIKKENCRIGKSLNRMKEKDGNLKNDVKIMKKED